MIDHHCFQLKATDLRPEILAVPPLKSLFPKVRRIRRFDAAADNPALKSLSRQPQRSTLELPCFPAYARAMSDICAQRTRNGQEQNKQIQPY